MAYINIHDARYPATQRPAAVGKPTPIPNNTMGIIAPRHFNKDQGHNVPVTKLVIRRQINT